MGQKSTKNINKEILPPNYNSIDHSRHVKTTSIDPPSYRSEIHITNPPAYNILSTYSPSRPGRINNSVLTNNFLERDDKGFIKEELVQFLILLNNFENIDEIIRNCSNITVSEIRRLIREKVHDNLVIKL